MTADQLKQIVGYGTSEQLRQHMAIALTELEAKAARGVGGKVPLGDDFKDFIDDVKAKVDALTAVA